MTSDFTEAPDIRRAMYERIQAFPGEGMPATYLGGRIFDTDAPQDTKTPYLVVTDTGGILRRTFGRGTIEGTMLQLGVWDDDFKKSGHSRRMDAIWDRLVDILEYADLHMFRDTFIQVRREGLPQKVVSGDMMHKFGNWLVENQFDRNPTV